MRCSSVASPLFRCAHHLRSLTLKAITPLAILLVVLSTSSVAIAGQYFQDFTGNSVGATSVGDGSQTFSSPAGLVSVQDATYKQLQLTANGIANTRSAFLLPDLDPGKRILAFSAKWNAEIYGDFPNAADGFSFNFGQLAALNLTGASYAPETGYGTGISFGVQTYADGNPGFYLRVNGVVIATQTNSPATQWGVNNTRQHFFEVDWHYANGITVRMDGQAIFTNVGTPGFVIQPGNRFVWAARTGALSEAVQLDNIALATGGLLKPVAGAIDYFGTPGVPPYDVDSAFDGNLDTYWRLLVPIGYLGITYETPKTPLFYTLSSSADFGYGSGSDPRTWRMEGSTNGTDWTVCSASSIGSFGSRKETHACPFTTSTSYPFYHLYITQSGGGSAVGLSELQLYELDPVEVRGWVGTAAPATAHGWDDIACSADASRLVAIPQSSSDRGIYVSINAGQSWQKTSDEYCSSVTSSTNGMVVVAVNFDGVLVSTDGGSTWTNTLIAPGTTFYDAACSSDGSKIIAVGDGFGAIGNTSGGWISTDFGTTWNPTGLPTDKSLWSVASSDSGERLNVASIDEGLYLSQNWGGSWNLFSYGLSWWTIACSPDGQTVLAGSLVTGDVHGDRGGMVRSINGGINYQQVSLPLQDWLSIAMAANGKVIASGGQGLWTSTDSGSTWTQIESPDSGRIAAVATSRDGAINVLAGSSIWITGTPTPGQPQATTGNSDQITGNSARFGAGINPNYTPTTYWFDWGVTTNYGNSTPGQDAGTNSTAQNFSLTVTNLAATTLYHYRAVASNALGVVYGTDHTFTTIGGSPIIGTTTVRTGFGRAVLSSSVNPNYFNTTVRFDYAPDPLPLTNSTPSLNLGAGAAAVAFSQSIDVVPGTTYRYRVVAGGNSEVNGDILTFVAPGEDNFVGVGTGADPVESSSTNFPAAENPANAFDNILATKYLNLDKTDTWLVLHAGITNRIVRALTVVSANAAPERNPASYKLEGSPDGTNFTLISSNSIPAFPADYSIQSFTFPNQSAFNAYRITFPTVANPASANSIQFAELELLSYGEITATNDTVSLSLPEGASLVTDVAQLFDRRLASNSDKFEVMSFTNEALVVDITPAAGPTILKGFELVGANDDADYPQRTPSTITVAGSQDGTNFTPITTRTLLSPSANMQIQEFSLNNTTTFAHYRVSFGAPMEGDHLQVGELRLFGEAVPPLLSIRLDGANVIASWPERAGFNLEAQSALGDSNWDSVLITPVLSNGTNTVTIPMTEATRFFRLKQ